MQIFVIEKINDQLKNIIFYTRNRRLNDFMLSLLGGLISFSKSYKSHL